MFARQAAWPAELSLLVLQPTPFCNVACDYCYLPGREETGRMDPATLEAAVRAVFASGLLGGPVGGPAGGTLDIAWHAGEPLVVGTAFYRRAFARIERLRPAGVTVRHGIQTNGMLIDDDWCALFKDHGVSVGLSLDGPQDLHDRHRRTRAGGGTHARALAGLRRLQANGIEPHAICVLTRDSLGRADAIVDFFVDAGIRDVGFNVEEIEAAHTRSSLLPAHAAAPEPEAELAAFFDRLLVRLRQSGGWLRIREVEGVLAVLRDPDFGRGDGDGRGDGSDFGSGRGSGRGNAQNTAFAMLSVACDGRVSTFSPELLGVRDRHLGEFAFGRVQTDPLAAIAADPRLRAAAAEIAAGVAACRRTCPYYAFCGGGAPANKLAEHGHFAGTETMACRLGLKTVVERVLVDLERHAGSPPAARVQSGG
jgi:uncharacterized protein